MSTEEWSIHDLAKVAGTTSRTLRHYGDLGLLAPSRVGANGYRYYDADGLVRLQRILLLRELGLGLPVIAEVLAGEQDAQSALRTHLRLLQQQQDRLVRQITSVRTTLHKLVKGEPLMATEVFDGFDHTQYKDEVIERWGKEAYDRSDRWWSSKTPAEKKAFQQAHVDIAADYARARAAGLAPDSAEVHAIVARHRAWVQEGWGDRELTSEAFTGLGEMYVADDRFAANYGGTEGAEFVRDAIVAFCR